MRAFNQAAGTNVVVQIDSPGSVFVDCDRQAGVMSEYDRVESKVLKAELRKLIATAMNAESNDSSSAPTDEAIDRRLALVIDNARQQTPKFLRVWPEQERRFEQGEFDDTRARKRLKSAINTLVDFDAKLPVLCERLLREDRAKPLQSAQLELAYQLFNMGSAKLEKLLSEGAFPKR